MKKHVELADLRVCIRGGGDLGSGVAWRLHKCGFKVFILETEEPLAVRRKVAFCEAVYDGRAVVEGVEAGLIRDAGEIPVVWDQGKIPLLIDPQGDLVAALKPEVLIDAILAKKDLGTSIEDAPLVIALGPGFEAGRDAHYVIETNRGHYMGRLLASGCAEPNTGVPGPVEGIRKERVLRSPEAGIWKNTMNIGDMVNKGQHVGTVGDRPVPAEIDGIIRGLIRPGVSVQKGLKIGDIDPRAMRDYCDTISEKALALGGGVLEGILRFLSK